MGVKGHAEGRLQVVLGVRPLPGVQGHQAQRPGTPGDPSAF